VAPAPVPGLIENLHSDYCLVFTLRKL